MDQRKYNNNSIFFNPLELSDRFVQKETANEFLEELRRAELLASLSA